MIYFATGNLQTGAPVQYHVFTFYYYHPGELVLGKQSG